MTSRLLYAIVVALAYASPTLAQEGKSEGGVVASAPGRIEGASDVMLIGTAATGIIREVLVKDGDHVKKDQVLVRVNCAAIEAEVRQRKSEVSGYDVALNRIRAGARDEEIAIASAIVKVSEARAEEADQALQRVMALPPGIASQERITETRRDSKVATATLVQDRQRLRMLEAGARGEDVLEAEAKKDSAVSALDGAVARLEQCTVRAPQDGIVLSTIATPGQFVTSTTPSLLVRLVDDSVLRVRAQVDERDLQKVCLSQHAKVTADGFKNISLTGSVTQIDPGMGRRTIITGERTEKADRDVRELLLTLDAGQPRWPIDLRVLVFFLSGSMGSECKG
jgi:HlyD family secretion protein